MKTINRASLPDQIKYRGKEYTLNSTLSDLYGDNKPFYNKNCIAVHVLPAKLKDVPDLHGKPYQPTKWIFTAGVEQWEKYGITQENYESLIRKAAEMDMQDLSDEEINRVYKNCVAATGIIRMITMMRDRGYSFYDMRRSIHISNSPKLRHCDGLRRLLRMCDAEIKDGEAAYNTLRAWELEYQNILVEYKHNNIRPSQLVEYQQHLTGKINFLFNNQLQHLQLYTTPNEYGIVLRDLGTYSNLGLYTDQYKHLVLAPEFTDTKNE
ncbi:hypothetical protein PV783_33965 [Chitinophaga sp. CC14]|uniref:hypothetical protein n=1 Tax=Chitinophaga sp. CC14 TaxID=3029199 RepID=UPI003B7F8F5F